LNDYTFNNKYHFLFISAYDVTDCSNFRDFV